MLRYPIKTLGREMQTAAKNNSEYLDGPSIFYHTSDPRFIFHMASNINTVEEHGTYWSR
jgi:hypothetical protein